MQTRRRFLAAGVAGLAGASQARPLRNTPVGILRATGAELARPCRYRGTPPEGLAERVRDAGLDTGERLLDWRRDGDHAPHR
ncbi:hypothetical protein [Histidinibacterium lentulum]|uniref:Uncharacterized protein n=1 Tax=Histidinibacterium lentulum TaxID=2480588 RepID=A0A3N2R862_9RHOB|nr:hypothetical protein [Histidinibacterium lentulum]ROU03660.1 hypothetical protein EAT49_05015 [Histidinibacterium lentulum]